MRLLLTALLVLLPGLTEAQRHHAPAPEPPASTLPPIGLSLAPIGLRLPQIGLLLPPIGLAPAQTSSQSDVAPAPHGRPWRQGHRKGRGGPGIVYVLPAYPWDGSYLAGSAAPAFDPPELAASPTAPATLRLEVEPRGVAEVYVDGYFVGMADDHRGEIALEPGSHRVEIRAVGYESERVDVRIEPGVTATLRRSLQPAGGAAPMPEPAPIARKPFYFIPGCYLGDVPPKDAGLPASCDQSKTVVVKP